MAQSIIADGESGASVRAKLNDRWQMLAQSSVAVTGPADTSENILATITVPGGAMGANGRLRIETLFTVTNDANNKILRIRLGGIGGTIIASDTLTTGGGGTRGMRMVGNRNSQSSQISGMSAGSGGFGGGGTAPIATTVDTSADWTIVITGQKASAGNALILDSYCVDLLYHA